MKKPSIFGKYLLLERLNVGGMAEVFVAKAFGVEGFERILAIKKILPTMAEDEEFITMFIDEARISVQLNHANVVHIHELGKHEDAYYIAMEYVSGKDLRSILERFRRRREIMPTAMAVFVASKICEGMDYAHRKKDARGQELHIIHRDVSPQTILCSYEGEVKIIDFGIAKAANRSQKTQAGILKGKFGYMSPEQVRGLPIDRRSDIFAVGVILYEMLTGEKLFVGESDFSTLEKVRNAEVASPRQFNPNIPAGLEKVVLKALAREVEDRYQWASDLQEDLMRFLLAGDAIYSAKHLSTFMKDAFAEDLLAEGEKMNRFAQVERPEALESSGITTSAPPKPARKPTGQQTPAVTAQAGTSPAMQPLPAPPRSRSSQSVAVASGSGAVAVGLQAATINIPPPTAEELAEMDQGGDRTVIVEPEAASALRAHANQPAPPGKRKESAPPPRDEPSRSQLRPRTKTSATSQTGDNLPPAPEGDVDATMPPQSRRPREEDTSNDMQPIEMTGFRPAIENEVHDTGENPAIVPDDTQRPEPGRNGSKKKIIIGDAPVNGATMIGPSPLTSGETRMYEEQGGEGEAEAQAEGEEQYASTGEHDVSDGSEEQADEGGEEQPAEEEQGEEQAEAQEGGEEQAEAEAEGEALGEADVKTGQQKALPRKATKNETARAKQAKPAAKPAGKRTALIVVVALVAVLAIVVIVASAVKLIGSGGKPHLGVLPKPEVPFTVKVTPPGKLYNNGARSIELAPGTYELEVHPSDDSFEPVTMKGVVLKGSETTFVTINFKKKAEAKPDELKPDEKKPDSTVQAKPDEKKPDEAKPDEKKPEATAKPEEKKPDAIAAKPDEKKPEEKKPDVVAAAEKKPDVAKPEEKKPDAAPATYTATITTQEPGVEIALNEKVVGKTPNLTVPNLQFDKVYKGIARKGGTTVNFELKNPDKKANYTFPVDMPKEAKPDRPEKKPETVAVRQPDEKKPDKPKEPREDKPAKQPAPKGAKGMLACTSSPVGAEVWIDGKNTGKVTPVSRTQAIELPVGKHKLTFKLGGKSSPAKDIVITDGETIVERGSL